MSQEVSHFMLPADAGWLASERPENPLITTVMLRVQGLTSARLREFLRIYWSAWERFRARPEPCAGYWRWQTSADFDAHQHLDIVLDRFSPAQQAPWVSAIASQPLPIYRPLWKFWLAPNAIGGPMLLLRIHRCYVDGPSLAQLFEQLFTASPQQHPVLYGAAHPADLERWLQCAHSWLSARVFGPDGPAPEADAARTNGATTGDLPANLKAGATGIMGLVGQLGRYLAQADDSASNLSAPLTGQRQCCWSAATPFAVIQAAAARLGVSTRDVIAAGVTAALQAQLGLSPQALDDAQIHLALSVDVRDQLPASLRPAVSAPGNGCGRVLLSLPVDGGHFLEWVYRIKQASRCLKGSLQPVFMWGITACTALMPEPLRHTRVWPGPARPSAALDAFDVFAGVAEQRYLAGCRVNELVIWQPQLGEMGLSVSVSCYAGELRLAVVADSGVNLDVHRFQNDCLVALEQALVGADNIDA